MKQVLEWVENILLMPIVIIGAIAMWLYLFFDREEARQFEYDMGRGVDDALPPKKNN
jgi:hypothetical protein